MQLVPVVHSILSEGAIIIFMDRDGFSIPIRRTVQPTGSVRVMYSPGDPIV